MKNKMLGLLFFLFAKTCYAQNGLENIVVEKYYISNAADSIGSIASGGGNLPVGSITYRVYADMLPGYVFQALYGTMANSGTGQPERKLLVSSSTSFFNNESFGATAPTFSATNVRRNSVLIDSWFSAGGAANGKVGVFKSEDTDGSPGNNTAPPILQNNDPLATGAINIGNAASMSAQDGIITGSPISVTFVNINNTGNGDLGVLDGTSQVGGLFSTNNGSIAALGGATGATTANRLLIGQFTTDGIFHFELNVQIGTPTGGVQLYVADQNVFTYSSGPYAGITEIHIASLVQTFGAPNIPPTVNITAPTNNSNYIINSLVGIAANASDTLGGSVDSVSFYVDGVFLSSDKATPYTANYAATSLGTRCITAKATDDLGAVTTTACTNIIVVSNPPPVLNITTPANLAIVKRNVLFNINANATDNTVVDSVAFYYDNVFIAKVLTSVTNNYAITFTPPVIGTHVILARATDNLGVSSTAQVTINVVNNVAPTVSITSPTNGASYTFPASVAINANAGDSDGSIDSVEFYVNGNKIGRDLFASYSINWSSIIGPATLIAKAYDNNGASTTSAPVAVSIVDPNALPYAIIGVSNPCSNSAFCLPITAIDSVKNVIGYDILLQYNKAKVTPTGNITVENSLINPSYVTVANSIDTTNGRIAISIYFNSSAPGNANFNGKGRLICVGFTKSPQFLSIDTAQFSITSLQESYFTGVVSKLSDIGKFITYKDSIFNGSLKNWIDNSPIKYNPANPSQYLLTQINGNTQACVVINNDVALPDTLGKFQYGISSGSSISFVKDILGTTDVMPVINGFDAMLTNKVLLNDLSFIPNVYQAIAMDVNIDGFISAGDVSQLNQRTVLMIPEFKQAWNYNAQGVSNGQPSKDWLFLDSITPATNTGYVISGTFPLNDGVGYSKSRVPAVPACFALPIAVADCPVITPESFKGVLIGDVNGNYASTSPNGQFRQTDDKIVLDLSKVKTVNGYVNVPVTIVSSDKVNSLDLSLQYDESKLAFNSTNDLTNYMESLVNFNADDRTLRFTSNSRQNYELNKSLLNLRFASSSSTIHSSSLFSLKGYLNGEEVSVEVKNSNGSALNDQGVLINVYPNPVKEILNVFVSQDALVSLMSLNGQEVLMETKINGGENQQISTSSLASGIFLLKIQNDKFVSFKKVVVNN